MCFIKYNNIHLILLYLIKLKKITGIIILIIPGILIIPVRDELL